MNFSQHQPSVQSDTSPLASHSAVKKRKREEERCKCNWVLSTYTSRDQLSTRLPLQLLFKYTRCSSQMQFPLSINLPGRFFSLQIKKRERKTTSKNQMTRREKKQNHCCVYWPQCKSVKYRLKFLPNGSRTNFSPHKLLHLIGLLFTKIRILLRGNIISLQVYYTLPFSQRLFSALPLPASSY